MNSKPMPATSGMTTTRLATASTHQSIGSRLNTSMLKTSTYRMKLVPQRTWLVSSLRAFSGTSSSPLS
jgi:hypothetical protein